MSRRNRLRGAPRKSGRLGPAPFPANNPGNGILNCNFPHHNGDAMLAGYYGAPVGMTRIFHYAGYAAVPPQYFAYQGQNSTKVP